MNQLFCVMNISLPSELRELIESELWQDFPSSDLIRQVWSWVQVMGNGELIESVSEFIVNGWEISWSRLDCWLSLAFGG